MQRDGGMISIQRIRSLRMIVQVLSHNAFMLEEFRCGEARSKRGS